MTTPPASIRSESAWLTASVYFFEFGLFNGLHPIQIKNFSCPKIMSYISPPAIRAGLRRPRSVEPKFIALISGFAKYISGFANMAFRLLICSRTAREPQEQFPNCTVDVDRIFINDGPIWTSAGMSAGIDLALALIEADLGQQVAQAVARKPVLYHRRAGPIAVLGFART
jgi:hypothetical protein